MRFVIAAVSLLLSSPAGAWDKVYDGAGVERFAERGGKLWALPGLSSSTDRGGTWSAGFGANGALDSDLSDDGRLALVLPQNYFQVTTLDGEDLTLEGSPGIAAGSVRFVGGSVMATGIVRDSDDENDGILLSRDNGASWTKALANKLPWRAVPFALDEKRAWIAAADDVTKVWRTTNGGKDWESSSDSKPIFGKCEELFFIDKKRGWLAAGSGLSRTVYATDDGGGEWEARGTIALSTAGAVALAFADKKRGWAAAPGALWATTDGGKTWTAAAPPPTAVLPEAVALRYVEERGRGRLLYGTARSELDPEDEDERAWLSRGEIFRMEVDRP